MLDFPPAVALFLMVLIGLQITTEQNSLNSAFARTDALMVIDFGSSERSFIMKYSPALAALVILGIGLILTGCSDSGTSPKEPGQLRLYLVDSPAAYNQVNIAVSRVEVHLADVDSASGWMVVNDSAETYDLLQLRNGANAILGDEMLPAGKYTQIRLMIGIGSTIVVDGVTYPLEIPSTTGVKLNHPFTIESGALYLLTLDFDADKSIVQTGIGQYKLQPVIRVIANVISGSISGIISPASAQAVIRTEVGIDTVAAYADTLSGAFSLVALPAGIYDLAITPTDTMYVDTIVADIPVIIQQDTDIGTVTLRHK
jgi:hypothetical protein